MLCLLTHNMLKIESASLGSACVSLFGVRIGTIKRNVIRQTLDKI